LWISVSRQLGDIRRDPPTFLNSVSKLYTQTAASRSRIASAINDPNLILTVLFCLVGLVITAVLIFCFPNLGAIIAQYNQF